jgi:hypothetical protein
MIVFAMLVNMITLFDGLPCQQHEFATTCGMTAATEEADSPPFIISFTSGAALIFQSKFLHFVIIRECLKECPFHVVCCEKIF